MLLLAALVATTTWSYGFSQEIPIQTPVSITMSQGTARLQCHFKDVSANFDNTVIHWYQQKENREPVRMLYILSGTTAVENSFQRNRYMVQNLSNQKICILIIKNIGPDDTATYYCAYWDSHYDRNPAITSTNTPSVAQPQTI
ncbi:TCR gamma alternate reading frame protein [Aix galericulata]|nr:TCR gamma alternate reading frame protein [Aix galericulata]